MTGFCGNIVMYAAEMTNMKIPVKNLYNPHKIGYFGLCTFSYDAGGWPSFPGASVASPIDRAKKEEVKGAKQAERPLTASFAMVLEGGRAAPGEASLVRRSGYFQGPHRKKDRPKNTQQTVASHDYTCRATHINIVVDTKLRQVHTLKDNKFIVFKVMIIGRP